MKAVEKEARRFLSGTEGNLPMEQKPNAIDRYAGDAAWREWFRECAVARCGADNAARLRAQISSALFAQLARAGLTRDDAGGDDPVAVFDAYFQLKGSRDKPKPLKAYFADRLASEGMRLFDFVCGTLFGAGAGRVHDIVVDWIASLKGWRPRALRGADGKRRIVWESAPREAAAELETLEARTVDPATLLDVAPLRRLVDAALERIARKIKTEKSHVALLFFATAQDVSMTEAAVLDELKVAKSRAYAMREKAMDELRKEARAIEGADGALFGRVLLDACAAALPPAARQKLGGAQ